MGIRSRIGKTRDKLRTGVREWLDVDRHESVLANLRDRINGLWNLKLPERKESFDEAQQRLGVSDADLATTRQGYLRLACLFLFFALCIFAYACFHLSGLHLRGALVSLGLTSVLCAFAFRYHFYAFQIQQRRLGCKFNEWVRATFLRSKL